MPVTCECGCGNEYPKSQCVRLKLQNHSEDLYIPHALDVWGLFTSVDELKFMLHESKIYGIHLPGDRLTEFLTCYPEYQPLKHYLPRKSPYGNWFIACRYLLPARKSIA